MLLLLHHSTFCDDHSIFRIKYKVVMTLTILHLVDLKDTILLHCALIPVVWCALGQFLTFLLCQSMEVLCDPCNEHHSFFVHQELLN